MKKILKFIVIGLITLLFIVMNNVDSKFATKSEIDLEIALCKNSLDGVINRDVAHISSDEIENLYLCVFNKSEKQIPINILFYSGKDERELLVSTTGQLLILMPREEYDLNLFDIMSLSEPDITKLLNLETGWYRISIISGRYHIKSLDLWLEK